MNPGGVAFTDTPLEPVPREATVPGSRSDPEWGSLNLPGINAASPDHFNETACTE
jgi:hypothetical protein